MPIRGNSWLLHPAGRSKKSVYFTGPDERVFDIPKELPSRNLQVAMATLAQAQVADEEEGVFIKDAQTCGHSVREYNALGAVAVLHWKNHLYRLAERVGNAYVG